MKSKEPGTIRQLFAFVGESNGKMRLSIFLAVLGELFGMGPFLMVAVLADALYQGTATPTLVLFLCGGAAVCQIIKMLLTWRSSLMSHKISFTILKNIREAITDRMAKVPMGVMLETPTGAFKNLIVDNVAKLEDSMAHFMPELPSNIAAPLCSILLIFLLDWRMGLAALVTIPLGTLFFAAMMRGYGPRMENYMRSANEMNSALVEYVNGIQVIKAFNRSAASYGKYADSVRYFHDSTMAWWSQCWLWNAAARAVLPSTLLGTLPVGAWLYMEGSLSLPVFLVALVVPLGFIAPLMKVSAAMEQVSMIKGNLEQVTTFLKTPELVRPTEPAELGERCYQFEDVHFAYNESEVLHGISFQTQPGTMTAIVGPSGSGKSTIAKLMAGFWDVTSGTVRFGGQDIRNIPFGQLMSEISYVAQDNFLFDKSIRENIRMGNPNASDGEVEAAAKAANCHDFIMQLEQGYDTMAGDAGDRLSGGWLRHSFGRGRRFSLRGRETAYLHRPLYSERRSYCNFGRGDRLCRPRERGADPAGYQQAGGGKVSDCRGPPAEYDPQCRPDIGCCQWRDCGPGHSGGASGELPPLPENVAGLRRLYGRRCRRCLK